MEVGGEVLLSREPSSVLVLEPNACVYAYGNGQLTALQTTIQKAVRNYPTNDELI